MRVCESKCYVIHVTLKAVCASIAVWYTYVTPKVWRGLMQEPIEQMRKWSVAWNKQSPQLASQ